jgi:hypothetical protein
MGGRLDADAAPRLAGIKLADEVEEPRLSGGDPTRPECQP